MPAQLSYPGVYVEEVPSGVRTIVGVATSITAFIGRTRWGLENRPTDVSSFDCAVSSEIWRTAQSFSSSRKE